VGRIRLPPRPPGGYIPVVTSTTQSVLSAVLAEYPPLLRRAFAPSLPRTAWHIETVREAAGEGATVVDVGGAVSLFAPACAALGMRAILIDDQFDDPYDREVSDAKREVLARVIRPLGVIVMRRDIGADGVGIPPESADAFTSFHVLEHLSRSPKAALHEMWKALRPGGVLLIGTPNSANLRKRISALFGRAKWSSMQDWYELPVFRGHVREPDVDDLRYIARDLRIDEVRVAGRNWMGTESPRPLRRAAARMADRALRLRPQLCSDIYLLGRKAA
jgi:SAM-dependent methyltransferase